MQQQDFGPKEVVVAAAPARRRRAGAAAAAARLARSPRSRAAAGGAPAMQRSHSNAISSFGVAKVNFLSERTLSCIDSDNAREETRR
jgi:hypothetical protein